MHAQLLEDSLPLVAGVHTLDEQSQSLEHFVALLFTARSCGSPTYPPQDLAVQWHQTITSDTVDRCVMSFRNVFNPTRPPIRRIYQRIFDSTRQLRVLGKCIRSVCPFGPRVVRQVRKGGRHKIIRLQYEDCGSSTRYCSLLRRDGAAAPPIPGHLANKDRAARHWALWPPRSDRGGTQLPVPLGKGAGDPWAPRGPCQTTVWIVDFSYILPTICVPFGTEWPIH